ncbi:iron ABC transporter permease [Acuticoccus sp. M5D2P5]|uniref:ABC transporter permease n=1 Tax=Acuticoccus kalidii TaxID=2910977 RepID=UPI001F33D9DA|nr:iron ABC transporter permease [Acuticoccus kalidii]MCF3936475.1 iron ABC transporter permease [Acuticoccus kalidii]
MSRLFAIGVAPEGGFALEPLLDTLGSRSTKAALWNSLESGLLSAFAATLLGTLLALVIGLTDVRAKATLVFLILIPMMIPPHVTAISWIQALGPSSPLLRSLGIAPEVGSTHPLYSREGVILLLSLQHTPLAFLVVRAALRAQPRELSDAARISGASAFRVMWRVVLPLLVPAIVAAFALTFVSALGNFGIPALLGIPGRYTTLPVLIWQRMASFGVGMLSTVAMIAMLMAAVAVVAVVLLNLLQRLGRTALIGPPRPPLAIRLGRMRPVVETGLWLFIAAVLVLPLASLLATALVRTYGLPLTLDTITLDNFAEILVRQQVTLRAFANSSLAAGLAAATLGMVAILVSHAMNGNSWVSRLVGRAVELSGDVTYAVPGIVLSIAFILTFIRPLPILGVSLYNTLGLIALAYVTAFLAIALKPVAAAFAQLDPSLDDAARVAGASYGRRMRRIFAPLVAPAAASGAILVFLTAYNEITVSALLWSPGNETIGTTIFNYEDGGYTTLAAAMSAVTVGVTVILMMLLDRMGRRLPAGTVPWRD